MVPIRLSHFDSVIVDGHSGLNRERSRALTVPIDVVGEGVATIWNTANFLAHSASLSFWIAAQAAASRTG